MRHLVFLSAISVLLFSCDNELDINATNEERTVIWGVLDQNTDTQFVKINKAYITEGDALVASYERENSEYTNLEVTVEETNVSGSVTNSWVLQEKDVEVTFDGPFNYSPQKVYYFVPDALFEDRIYTIKLNNGTDDVQATTELVRDFVIDRPKSNATPIYITNNGGDYNSTSIDWFPAEFGERYESLVRFHYLEKLTTGALIPKSIDYKVGTRTSDNPGCGNTYCDDLNGELFFNYILSTIDVSHPDFERVQVGNLDFIITVAGKDLHTYIEVNKPSTGIIQERPEYTNVINGLGVFSSRYNNSIENKEMSKESTRKLVQELEAIGIPDCSNNTDWSAEDFYCD